MAPELVRVHKTEVRDGTLMGYCELTDGSFEWRMPSNVEVTITNDRTGEQVEVTDAKVVSACE